MAGRRGESMGGWGGGVAKQEERVCRSEKLAAAVWKRRVTNMGLIDQTGD